MIQRAELRNENGKIIKIKESEKSVKVYFDVSLMECPLNGIWNFNSILHLCEKCGYRIISMYMNSKENEE